MPESLRMLAMVDDIESAASAVSSTAAVIEATVCACASIASRMRCADSCTSTIVAWIDWLAFTAPLVACWIAVILPAMSSVARAVSFARLFTSCETTAKPRPDSPARARSEEHTSELQSLMRNSYAVFCLHKKTYQVQIQKQSQNSTATN